MRWRNTHERWGAIAVVLHWLIAATVVGLFALGLYMTGLNYYDPWYKAAPDLHRSIGLLLFVAVLARLGWRLLNVTPAALPAHGVLERRAAAFTHAALYALLLAVMLAGYLLSTAKGQGISVFGWFEVPALLPRYPHLEDYAGDVHYVLAMALIAAAGIHAVAALKHHFVDRDRTLVRMFGR